MPTVVAVASTAVYQTPDYGYSWFFGGGSQSYEVPSSGSGIIIGKNDTELLIVTNNHVVKDTVSLKITFVDDTAVECCGKGDRCRYRSGSYFHPDRSDPTGNPG